jgi:hypothetical protein
MLVIVVWNIIVWYVTYGCHYMSTDFIIVQKEFCCLLGTLYLMVIFPSPALPAVLSSPSMTRLGWPL